MCSTAHCWALRSLAESRRVARRQPRRASRRELTCLVRSCACSVSARDSSLRSDRSSLQRPLELSVCFCPTYYSGSTVDGCSDVLGRRHHDVQATQALVQRTARSSQCHARPTSSSTGIRSLVRFNRRHRACGSRRRSLHVHHVRRGVPGRREPASPSIEASHPTQIGSTVSTNEVVQLAACAQRQKSQGLR